MREFLKGLDLDSETIDTIMAEYGKNVTGLKEKVENYKQELDSYKGKIEELNKTLEEDKQSLENLKNVTNENKDLKTRISLRDANVKKEFEKFVTSEISQLVNDETDTETALKTFKKDYPQYFGDVVVKKVQSSPELTGGDTKPQTTNNIMNDILRGSRN